jgi:pimeloyl-ACP methyl ester carboxylesterase
MPHKPRLGVITDLDKRSTPLSSPATNLRFTTVHGMRIFYREAGDPDAPTILLLHGFPTSSHMYRSLIPLLATQYRVIAPDMPGFGFTEAPSRQQYEYTFDNLARTMGEFIDRLGITQYALQVFDYGAPVGLRLALARPHQVSAIVSQNGNAYEDGLSSGWDPIQAYWREPTEDRRSVLRVLLSPESVKWQYTHGVTDLTAIAPESYTLDSALLARPGNDEIQLDLFLDYSSNVALYPQFQQYFRAEQPSFLAVWGKNDPFFLPAGANAFKRDIKNAEVHFFDTGHFALETHADEIAHTTMEFLDWAIG